MDVSLTWKGQNSNAANNTWAWYVVVTVWSLCGHFCFTELCGEHLQKTIQSIQSPNPKQPHPMVPNKCQSRTGDHHGFMWACFFGQAGEGITSNHDA